MNKQSKKVKLCVISHAALNYSRAYLLGTEITKRHLNKRICQHCGVKTSTLTPTFYYVYNISLSCENSIPSFIGKCDNPKVDMTYFSGLGLISKSFFPFMITFWMSHVQDKLEINVYILVTEFVRREPVQYSISRR